MPKFYCEYCDIYLTHSSPIGRRQHNHGRKHVSAKIEYFQNLIREEGITPQNFLVFLNPRNGSNPLDHTNSAYMNNYDMNMYMKYNDMKSGPYSHRNMPYNNGMPYGIPSNKYIRAGHYSPATSKFPNIKYIKGQQSNINVPPHGSYMPNAPMGILHQGIPVPNGSYNNTSYANNRVYNNQPYPYPYQHNNNNTNFNSALNIEDANNKNKNTNQQSASSDHVNLFSKTNEGEAKRNVLTSHSQEAIETEKCDANKEKTTNEMNATRKETVGNKEMKLERSDENQSISEHKEKTNGLNNENLEKIYNESNNAENKSKVNNSTYAC